MKPCLSFARNPESRQASGAPPSGSQRAGRANTALSLRLKDSIPGFFVNWVVSDKQLNQVKPQEHHGDGRQYCSDDPQVVGWVLHHGCGVEGGSM